MIGLLFLTGLGLWIATAVLLSKRIPRWLGISKHRTMWNVLLFPVVLVAPITDDLIGRWQFYRLCDREAVVTLSPDAGKVQRASWKSLSVKYYNDYFIPITSHGVQYVDVDTGKEFMTSRSLFTPGGFLQRHLYGFGGTTACHPPDERLKSKQLNLDLLLKQGEMK